MRQQVYFPTNLTELLDKVQPCRDLYKSAAAVMFGCEPDEVDTEERLVGKITVLRLGYWETPELAPLRYLPY